MTYDHKVSIAAEKLRVIKSGIGKTSVNRVQPYGLAMTRSLGDVGGKCCGIISKPDVKTIIPDDETSLSMFVSGTDVTI